MTQPLAIDSITASVVQGALENIAVEMGYKLMRMSYSSIIRESEDFGAALVDAEGRGLAESAQSTPLQSGPIPGYIRGILKALRERRDAVRPGDVIMHNDAYGGASHGPDVGFAVPVFHDGRLVAFAATTAHHLDIGALSPGSCGIVDAIDAYAEGLQFKAIKVYDRGVRNDAVWQLLRDNIRVSDLVVGDMEAQIAAARIGAERLVALIERYGYQRFTAACSAVMDYAERLMRQAIAALPDGDYDARTMIDDLSTAQTKETTFAHCCHCAGARRPNRGRPNRHCRPGRRSADQHAVRGYRRRRGVVDRALSAPRYRRAWSYPDESWVAAADQDHSTDRLARQSDISGADDRPLLPRQPARGHCNEGIGASGSRPGSEISK